MSSSDLPSQAAAGSAEESSKDDASHVGESETTRGEKQRDEVGTTVPPVQASATDVSPESAIDGRADASHSEPPSSNPVTVPAAAAPALPAAVPTFQPAQGAA